MQIKKCHWVKISTPGGNDVSNTNQSKYKLVYEFPGYISILPDYKGLSWIGAVRRSRARILKGGGGPM